MIEKRKFKRIPVDIEFKYIKILEDITGRIKNISEDGFCFLTEEKLEPNSYISIEIKIKSKKIKTYAKIIWVKQKDKKNYEIGAKFIDLDSPTFNDDIKKILNLLEE
ncbi:MAG TPA: PilZ domain-containing protein [bacterium]|nr:PilZ domain-containing protein [bacterium]HOL48457.1 PilZ domain-containing protein [bacterium]HPQ19965.1 PilZ domain-containing protein [bacterium]